MTPVCPAMPATAFRSSYKNQIERRAAAQLKKRAGVVPATRLTTPIWHSHHST